MAGTRFFLRLMLLFAATPVAWSQPAARDDNADTPGAVRIAPPIVRNQGMTTVAPDRPMLGRINTLAPAQSTPFNEQPPALTPAPNREEATSNSAPAGNPSETK